MFSVWPIDHIATCHTSSASRDGMKFEYQFLLDELTRLHVVLMGSKKKMEAKFRNKC